MATLPKRAMAGIFSAKTFLISMSVLASICILQLSTIDAYSIVPQVTRKSQNVGIRSTIEQRRHWQSQPKSLLPTSLRASRSFDYVRNATAPASTYLEEEDDTRLLRFMEDALLELESFQKDADSQSLKYAEEDSILDGETYFAFTSEDVIHNQDVSLLFPPIEDTFSSTSTEKDTSLVLHNDSTEESIIDQDAVWRARWLLVAAAALYGTNFSVVKLLGDTMPVGISTSLRFGLASLATLPWLIQGFVPSLFQNKNQVDQKELTDRRIMAALYGLEVGLWNSIGYVTQAVGLETTLASESAFLCSMAVVIVPLLDWIAGKKLLSRQWVGALMALVGVAFLELGDVNVLLENGGGISAGTQLSLIQPFTFGLGFWRMEQAMHQFPEEAPRMTAAQLFAVFLSSVAYGLWTVGVFEPMCSGNDFGTALAGCQTALAGVSAAFPWQEWFRDPAILFSLFWTGCITTALTIYMETLALESLSAAETTLIFSTEPLWGTAFAVAVMGEQMGVNSVVGAGLILTACVYSNLGVSGLKDLWSSMTKNEDQNKNVFRNLGLLAGFGASAAVASETELHEFDDIVEELIDNMVDKL